MADIQMQYRENHCEMFDSNEAMICGRDMVFLEQCYTGAAGDMDCPLFEANSDGSCAHATFKTIYKGISVKRYDIEEVLDPYSPKLDCMQVKIRNECYDCDKVILDGVQIYPKPKQEVTV